uniref:Uncharacterized protein n=1 Tax=Rhizophora mucronata TaxID=61149 RepID=A0A2P2NXY4_RHIMU
MTWVAWVFSWPINLET